MDEFGRTVDAPTIVYVVRYGPSKSYRDRKKMFPTFQAARWFAQAKRLDGWSVARIQKVQS